MKKFDGLDIHPSNANRTLLFCVGRGGDPVRHRPLLDYLALSGCRVIAPRFDRLMSPMIDAEALSNRVKTMENCVAMADPNMPLFGLGHSMGATTLLVLSGAHARTFEDAVVKAAHPIPFDRMALLAPAVDFFLPPKALDSVGAKVLVWSGGEDMITPPARGDWLVNMLPDLCEAEHRVTDQAGHFTFMNQPPPHADEPHPDQEAFLLAMTASLSDFMACCGDRL